MKNLLKGAAVTVVIMIVLIAINVICNVNGHELDPVSTGVVGSGIQLDRPGLAEVMQALQEKRMDALVVKKLDRLARHPLDAYRLIELFKEKGVDLICTDENLTPDLFVTRFLK